MCVTVLLNLPPVLVQTEVRVCICVQLGTCDWTAGKSGEACDEKIDMCYCI